MHNPLFAASKEEKFRGYFPKMLYLDDEMDRKEEAGRNCLDETFSGNSSMTMSLSTMDEDELALPPPPPPPSSSPKQRTLGNHADTCVTSITHSLTHSLAYLIAGGSIGSIRKRISYVVSPSCVASLEPETDEESKKRDSQMDREMMAQNTRNVEDFAVNIAALPGYDIPQVTLSDEAFNSIRFICNGTFSHVYTAMMKSSVLDEQTFQLLVENAKTKATCFEDVL